jgi:hypothetical protein
MLKRIVLLITILPVLMTLALPLQPAINAAVEKNTHQDRAEGGRVVEGFQLYLTAERETILPGEVVLLKIRLKNFTREAVFVKDASTRYDYRPDVRNQSGQEAPLTEKGRQLKDILSHWEEISAKFPKIEPKKSKEYTLDITELYDFKRGETYLITVSRMVGRKDNQGKLKVTSNTIRIKVV